MLRAGGIFLGSSLDRLISGSSSLGIRIHRLALGYSGSLCNGASKPPHPAMKNAHTRLRRTHPARSFIRTWPAVRWAGMPRVGGRGLP
jgi:hypothetical protein